MRNPIINDTPVEVYGGVYVKREDLCCPDPGPSFSKMRGVYTHIAARPEKIIGVLDTYHSKAGWAVAWACSKLGKRCIDFWPKYKLDFNVPNFVERTQQLCALNLGATLHALPAGRSAILYHRAKKLLAEYSSSYMMPNALKLPETIAETAAEVRRTTRQDNYKNVVISISSGTIAAGVLLGLYRASLHPKVYLHEGYSRSSSAVLAYLVKMAGEGAVNYFDIEIVDEGYAYKDFSKSTAPFPCNPYYDLKAWDWLQRNKLKGKTLFWNIGA